MIFEFKYKSHVKDLIELLFFMIYSFPKVLRVLLRYYSLTKKLCESQSKNS
jgi:hypothetical protein